MCRNVGGDILVLDDGVYPTLLRETYDPPVTLYVKGAWSECLERRASRSSARDGARPYGQNAALMLARELALRGVTIISGLARGIDARRIGARWKPAVATVGVMGSPGSIKSIRENHQEARLKTSRNKGALVTHFRSAPRRFRKTFRIAIA
jgi:DNA processing protein